MKINNCNHLIANKNILRMSIIWSPFLGNGTINPNIGSWPKCRGKILCPSFPTAFQGVKGFFFPFSFPVSEFPHHYHHWTSPSANSSAFVTLRWLKCCIQIEMLVLSCHLGMSSWVWNELFSLLDPDGSDGDVLKPNWECCREQGADGTGWGDKEKIFCFSPQPLL